MTKFKKQNLSREKPKKLDKNVNVFKILNFRRLQALPILSGFQVIIIIKFTA